MRAGVVTVGRLEGVWCARAICFMGPAEYTFVQELAYPAFAQIFFFQDYCYDRVRFDPLHGAVYPLGGDAAEIVLEGERMRVVTHDAPEFHLQVALLGRTRRPRLLLAYAESPLPTRGVIERGEALLEGISSEVRTLREGGRTVFQMRRELLQFRRKRRQLRGFLKRLRGACDQGMQDIIEGVIYELDPDDSFEKGSR